MAFESRSNVLKDKVYNNILRSNNVLVINSMDDDYSKGFDFYNNKMERINTSIIPAGNYIRNFENNYNWDYGEYVFGGGVIFLDNNWDKARSKYDYWHRNGHTGQARFDSSIRVTVQKKNGKPIKKANVKLESYKFEDVPTTSCKTGKDGTCSAIGIDFEVRGIAGCDRFACQKEQNEITFNPYELKVSADCFSTEKINVTIGELENEIVVQLSKGTCRSTIVLISVLIPSLVCCCLCILLCCVILIIIILTFVFIGKKKLKRDHQELDGEEKEMDSVVIE